MLPPREPDSRLTATVSDAGTPEAPAWRSPRKPWCGDSRSACPLPSCPSPRFERCSGIIRNPVGSGRPAPVTGRSSLLYLRQAREGKLKDGFKKVSGTVLLETVSTRCLEPCFEGSRHLVETVA